MEVTVADLQLGDEFLYAIQGTITRAKVIRPVQVRKVQHKYNPYSGKVYYKAVKCKVAVEHKVHHHTWGGKVHTFTKKEYNASDNYTVEKFVDLNHRNVWLIKKED